ncbi:IMS domain-containing protein [Trichocoleus sp. ST-U1]|nr:IMS domain-containing protein [Coleofasciculus sp. FACHB-SPT36]
MMPTLLDNRYRIIQTLGAGGFGETFLAEDIHMPSGRRCAIKRLKPVTNNPQYQLIKDRFQREAAILEELGEGNYQIPRLYAYFAAGDQFYLVQEWIEGETLAQMVQQQGSLSESSVREILVNLLPVLDYVHHKGIVHRDIKPANVIVRKRDTKPVLIDFGAVKETMGTIINSEGRTISSIVIGTPGFMPSEQAIGRPLFSSDLYSLGLTAIYLLTGKLPQSLNIDRDSGEILWHQYTLNVSASLLAVLDKAIQSHPSDRYTNVQEMLHALETPVSPIPPTVPYIPPSVVSPPPENTYQPSTVPSYPPEVASLQTAAVSSSQPVATRTISDSRDWQKAVILGSVIGVAILGGILFTTGKLPSFFANRSPNIENPQQAQQEAVALINRWVNSKREIFAPPFNRELAAELTTGQLYENTVSKGGSMAWLENNNAYYQYGVQKVGDVEQFIVDGDRATIEIRVTEERTLYKNGNIDPNETDFKTRLVRYTLQSVDSKWKILEYKTIREIQ